MPRKVILATGTDQGYYPRTTNYLHSAQVNPSFDAYSLVCLDFEPDAEARAWMRPWVPAPAASGAIAAMNPNRCMQHGAFVQFMGADDDDVILFTDADIRIQRLAWSQEMELLRELKHGDVFVGPNRDEGETLIEEATYLRPVIDLDAVPALFTEADITMLKCYNTGVMAATAKTFSSVYEEYVRSYHKVEHLFEHYARQQWLLSYIFGHRGDMRVRPMSQAFHMHGCHGMPQHGGWNGQNYTFMGVDVLFAHNLDWVRGA
jgi:hypothetical protein